MGSKNSISKVIAAALIISAFIAGLCMPEPFNQRPPDSTLSGCRVGSVGATLVHYTVEKECGDFRFYEDRELTVSFHRLSESRNNNTLYSLIEFIAYVDGEPPENIKITKLGRIRYEWEVR